MSLHDETVLQSPHNQAPTLPSWCNFYAGLSDEEIAELEKIVLDRSNFMRPWQDDDDVD